MNHIPKEHGNKWLTGLRDKINLTACLLICVWMFLPSIRARAGISYLIAFFGIWLVTTDFLWLKKMSRDSFYVAVFFVTFVPYFLSGTLEYGFAGPKAILVNFPIFFIGLLINQYYMYYKKDKRTLGIIALVTLAAFTAGAMQTYIGLKQYPMASRILATGTDFYIQERILYAQLGIGGFSYIYASCFVVIGTVYLIFNKMNIAYKLISLVAFGSIILMIIKASYAIALVIAFAGILLGLVVKNNRSLTIIIIVIVAVLLILPSNLMGELILEARILFRNNPVIYNKINDLAMGFIFDTRSGQAANRLDLYALSLQSFFRQPLFGVYGSSGNSFNAIGWHSGWLDILGAYGLFAGIPLCLVLIYNYKKHMVYFNQTRFSGFYLVTYFLFIVLGFINPILYIYEIGFTIFCIIPAVPFLPYSFSRQESSH